MKRRVSIRVDVELESNTPTGIDEAAQEALAQIRCNSFIDCGGGYYQSVTLCDKQFICQDEHLLLEMVLQATGVSAVQFIKGRNWKQASARNIFAFFAKKYMEWSDNQIANFVQRDRSTVTYGVRSIVSLATRTVGRNKKVPNDGRSILVAEAMAKIQTAWNRVKE